MSKIDWTDKDSVKWFVLLPSGHEGPYSLNQLAGHLQKKKLAADVKIWAEGLDHPVSLSAALIMKQEEDIAELPPIPEDEIPPIPLPEEETTEVKVEEIPSVPSPKNKKVNTSYFLGILPVILMITLFQWYAGNHQKVSIRRMPKMDHDLYERIQRENVFQSWKNKIFFKEYFAKDFSHIWLVTSGFQQCDVNAVFTSLPEKLLTMKDDKVSFKASGRLEDHVVEFSQFDFQQGTRIVPGMYEMDVKATDCNWSGIIPRVKNNFFGPDSEYVARMKVILFPGSPEEFQQNLDNLVRKKTLLAQREKSTEELFWEGLNQKFQTLEAISLQIEQHFLDFLENDSKDFKKNLKPMVDDYTRKFGSFLTSFVVNNENDFKSIDTKGSSKRNNYELTVRLTAKNIGLQSMIYIEEFQNLKKSPTKKDLERFSDRIRKTFTVIKQDISGKLSQVSKDQEKSQDK